MNKVIHSYSKQEISDLLLLAAFLKHSGDLYDPNGGLASLGIAVSGCTALWC